MLPLIVGLDCTLPCTTDFDKVSRACFASKLFLEAFDMVDTCHMNTIEGVCAPIIIRYVN